MRVCDVTDDDARFFNLSGRLGAMVTVTLQLGISILNGGNILVQQVNGRQHSV